MRRMRYGNQTCVMAPLQKGNSAKESHAAHGGGNKTQNRESLGDEAMNSPY